MKTKIFTDKIKYTGIMLLILGVNLKAQTTTENYIKSTEYLTENGASGTKLETVTYYDGIGREIQQILIKGSPNNRDIIVHHSYDPLTGRKIKDFLPVPTQQNSGNLVAGAETLTSTYYNDNFGESVYFAEKKLDALSMGSRILEQGFPGDDWGLTGGHGVKYAYQTNAANEVRRYSASSSWNGATGLYHNGIVEMGFYNAGELRKTVIRDEQNISPNVKSHSSETYKDNLGRTILTRKYGTEGSSSTIVTYDTYFIYDNYDNLVYIVPPLVRTNDGISASELQLITHYSYDNKFRIAQKKIPDQGITYLVYDNQNRLVASQDAKQREDGVGEWTFTKYDKFGRVTYTGFTWESRTRKEIQDQINTLGNNDSEYLQAGFNHDNLQVYYRADKGYPLNNFHILTIHYYDKYNGLTQAGVTKPTTVEGEAIRTDANSIANNTKGLPTSTTSRMMGHWLWEHTYSFYDAKTRPVRTHKVYNLPSGETGYSKVDSKLDFLGRPTFTKTYHKRGSLQELVIQDNFSYIKQFLTFHTQSINGSYPERIASNTYNQLGQLEAKTVGNKTNLPALQQIDFNYNIRGWLKGINNIEDNLQLRGIPGAPLDDIFAMSLSYNDLLYEGQGEVSELYNGNISQNLWKTASDNTLRGYVYEYDPLSRLREAKYIKPNTLNPFPGNFDERATYDKNGNILTLKRHEGFDNAANFEVIDDLAYTYGPILSAGQYYTNMLSRVTDGPSTKGFNNGSSGTTLDYTYDANGNMKTDKNKGITGITYNYLNLPTQILWSATKKIDYLYNASGQKIQKKVTSGTTVYTTDYLDGFQYFNGTLQYFPHPEGYVKQTALSLIPTFDYVYNYTDHLGNIRLSYAKDPATGDLKILDENHYYPFGLKHQKYSNAVPKDILANETETSKAVTGIDPNNPVLNIFSNYDYKYNGQEWQDEHALNMYAMDFRNYDPTIGRFHNPDLLAEISPDWSPYRFAFNNPVAFNDPTGLREGDDGGPGDIEVNVFFDEESKHVEFDFLGAHWKINVPEGGADPEGDGINYAGEDLGEYVAQLEDFVNIENPIDNNMSYSPQGEEICIPCVVIPLLLIGGTAAGPTGNKETDRAGMERSTEIQGGVLASVVIPGGAGRGKPGVIMMGSKNFKIISPDVLKKAGIDAHTIKYDYLGKGASVSKYDLYKQTVTNEILILQKGGKGTPIHTGIFLK